MRARAAHLGKPRVPTEAQEQIAVARYLNLHRDIVWLHVPNGGSRGRAEAGIFKAMGVRVGCPDLLILTPPPLDPRRTDGRQGRPWMYLTPSGPPVGVACEMKRQGATMSSVSDEQAAFGYRMVECGWYWYVARGSGEAIDELIRLGY